jgi:hypothetical protein
MIDIAKYKEKRVAKERAKMAQRQDPKCIILDNCKKAPDGCWNWQRQLTKGGYGQIYFNGKNYRAHRLAYIAFNGPFDEELFVCHKCDNTKCVNPNHLFLGTCKDNTHDSINKGRFYQKYEKGHKPSNRLIGDVLAKAIKNSLKPRSGYGRFTLKQIADIYDVPYQLVKDIKAGRSYVNV